MQRWNGWGDDNIYLNLPNQGLRMLHDLIGKGQVQPDYPLEMIIGRIPESRLDPHPLISFDPKLRLDHAHGQSLPDWIGLRTGKLQRYPDGVALPTTTVEIQELLRFAIDNNVVVIPYGGGTSVVGHLEVPETRRPVLSLSLECFNRLTDLNSDSRLATFEAGIRGPQLEYQLNSRGFTLGHYPQSFDYSSLGGWVVTRSSGQQSRHYGRIEQLFAGGDVSTPRGSLKLPPFPASAAGPDLRQILLGSEGRMGVLTNVVVNIVALPEKDDVYGVFFPSWERAIHAAQTIAGTDITFSMMRLSNHAETMTNLALAGNQRQTALLNRYLRLRGISEKKACMCLVGFTGSRRLTAAARRAAFSIIRRYKGICVGKPMGFLLPIYEDQSPSRRTMQVGLSLYDIMARERQHHYYDAEKFIQMVPHINPNGLKGGFHFLDAQVDDSRLVLRLINESVASGACALNYTAVRRIDRDDDSHVVGVELEDVETHEIKNVSSPAVINATGSWAEKLHPSPDPQRHLRPLRGSHLVFTAAAIPLNEGFSFMHPLDNRAVFVIPWEGAMLAGTTDLDHPQDLSIEPNIAEAEVTYLMEGIQAIFPSLNISLADCLYAFAGIRPVFSEGKLKPSDESREHVVWVDQGLVTVTGGKLTTFRRLALDALKAVKSFLPPDKIADRKTPVFSKVQKLPALEYGLSLEAWRRLYGRYGSAADTIVKTAKPIDLTTIPGTHTLWAELPYVAQNEQIRHLGDLMLRRVRIGLLTPQGGKAYLTRIRKLCKKALPWDRRRWKKEINLYLAQWNHAHALPIRRAEVQAQRKTISFKALGAISSFIYYKFASGKKRRKSSGIS